MVVGSDADGDNVTYIISPSASDRIRERFFVFPESGVVILRQTISTETQTRYVVCSIMLCLAFSALCLCVEKSSELMYYDVDV